MNTNSDSPEVEPEVDIPTELIDATEQALAELTKDDLAKAVYGWVNRCCSRLEVGRERDYVEAACVRFAIGLLTECYERGCKKAEIAPAEIELLLRLLMQRRIERGSNSKGNGHED